MERTLIDECKTFGDAVCLCLERRIRRLSEGEIAGYLGFRPPHLAKVKQGKGYLTSDQEAILERLCSNTAISQYARKRQAELERMIPKPDISDEMKAMVEALVAQKLAEAKQEKAA
ncbi:hypothetical protein WI75_08705 [Burkholderia ubonensis]|nr:hypothetical protein WI75_08705 [Burkholderia ubonensis]KWN80837.1 hypothetical protein WM24_23665 [Burkholderia ubonensis]